MNAKLLNDQTILKSSLVRLVSATLIRIKTETNAVFSLFIWSIVIHDIIKWYTNVHSVNVSLLSTRSKVRYQRSVDFYLLKLTITIVLATTNIIPTQFMMPNWGGKWPELYLHRTTKQTDQQNSNVIRSSLEFSNN